jgi:hypothetical protein
VLRWLSYAKHSALATDRELEVLDARLNLVGVADITDALVGADVTSPQPDSIVRLLAGVTRDAIGMLALVEEARAIESATITIGRPTLKKAVA